VKKFLHIPEVKSLLAIVAEGATLWEAVEAAKARAIKGRQRSENPDSIDLTNTGTCSICRNRQKLQGSAVAHHGYRITSGLGQYLGRRVGKCFGCAFPPYEISCAGNEAYKPLLETEKVLLEIHLAKLVGGHITRLLMEVKDTRPGAHPQDTVKKMVRMGEKGWERLYENKKHELEWKISGLAQQIEYHAALIAGWTLKPLAGEAR
jgi:hypothetical protein